VPRRLHHGAEPVGQQRIKDVVRAYPLGRSRVPPSA
jgi:hypothetical protein